MDSIEIRRELCRLMKAHKGSFQNREYFDSTEIIVDSIMYDSTLQKIAVFVIAKNPTYRNPYSDSKLPFYYNANTYLGRRVHSTSNQFELKCLCRFSEVNFNDAKTVVAALKEDFFTELATVKNENDQPVFEYNLDDVRFCSSQKGWYKTFPNY